MTRMIVLLAVLSVAGACNAATQPSAVPTRSGVDVPALDGTSAPSLRATPSTASISPTATKSPRSRASPTQSLDSEMIAEWFASRPPVVSGRYATTDTSAYDDELDRLSAVPSVNRALDARLTDEYSYLAIRSPEHLASMSRLAVRGRVLAFGRPYFNSLDGSYWDPSLVGPDAGHAVASEILRDVLFEVDDVLADVTGTVAAGDVIEFTVRGGQAVVTITESPSGGGDDHPLPPGTYVFSSEPRVDLSVGESTVVYLNYEKLDGLYDVGGTKYGYIYRLMPAHDAYYKWSIVDGSAANESLGVEMSLAELKALATSSDFASAAGPAPDETIHPQEAHP